MDFLFNNVWIIRNKNNNKNTKINEYTSNISVLGLKSAIFKESLIKECQLDTQILSPPSSRSAHKISFLMYLNTASMSIR